jgi:serine O-acetyltransferase
MSWLSDFRCDLRKYSLLNDGAWWKQLLLEQGLWALLEYRIEAALQRSHLPGMIKNPLRVLMLPWRKLVEITTGITLPCTAVIGPGLHLPHCGFRAVNAAAIIGADCCISQGVTIGVSGGGERRGVPVIGDRVYLGANSVVAGKIVVGSDVCIGANSLVIRNVSPHCTVQGVPAVTISNSGSEDYITITTGSARESKMAGLPSIPKVWNQSAKCS